MATVPKGECRWCAWMKPIPGEGGLYCPFRAEGKECPGFVDMRTADPRILSRIGLSSTGGMRTPRASPGGKRKKLPWYYPIPWLMPSYKAFEHEDIPSNNPWPFRRQSAEEIGARMAVVGPKKLKYRRGKVVGVEFNPRNPMKMMTREILKRLPPLYSTQNQADPIVQVKFFTPWAGWTWFATEFDPVDRLFFGMVHGHEKEMGYFSLDELESIRGPAGLRIERDLYWRPVPLSQVRSGKASNPRLAGREFEMYRGFRVFYDPKAKTYPFTGYIGSDYEKNRARVRGENVAVVRLQIDNYWMSKAILGTNPVVKMSCQSCGKAVPSPSSFRTPEHMRAFMTKGLCQSCQDAERLREFNTMQAFNTGTLSTPHAFFVLQTQLAANGEYKLLLAVEGTKGYFTLSKTMGKNFAEAERQAESMNAARLGLTSVEAWRIQARTMRPL